MNTIITYKVVYVDSFGDITEQDFDTEAEARTFSSSINDSIIYKVAILGSIERLI